MPQTVWDVRFWNEVKFGNQTQGTCTFGARNVIPMYDIETCNRK